MVITYPQSNGRVAVIVPASDVNSAIKDIPPNVEYKIIESVDIDNIFFNAYEFDNITGVKINIEKAKDIQKNFWRQARTPLLQKLDIEYIKALEINDPTKQQEIISKKQALRDVTNTPFPPGENLQNIKNTWPWILGGNPFI